MKFLCLRCDEAMRLQSTAGPDEGSLTVTFGCPRCGHAVAMLTNPWETQLVRTLGVKVGGRATEAPPAPLADVRASLARQRDSALVDEVSAPAGSAGAAASADGPGCPFAAMIPGLGAGAVTGDGPLWTPEAEARVERIPTFIRPMAKVAIERFARERGYGTVTEAVMDEARGALGM
jgi:Proto-chlorophyllide reductase 57 kD subunit